MNECFAEPRIPLMYPFSVADKRECLSTVALIMKMSEISRLEGILALERFIHHEDGVLFLKKGVMLLCDGASPALLREILQNYIMSSAFKGAELLKRILIMEGLLSIQSGESPVVIREKLLSWLGEDFYEEASLYVGGKKTSDVEAVREYFEDMTTETYPNGTNLLEDAFAALDNRAIQMILREMKTEDFAKAFIGSSKKIQKRLCDNLSLAMAVNMINRIRFDPMPETADILTAQHIMLSVYYKMLAGRTDDTQK